MAASQITLGFPSGTKIFTETDLENTPVAVVAVAATIYQIEVDNTLNPSGVVYFKLYDTAGAVVVGTAVPDWVIRIPGGVKKSINMADGIVVASGITVACVTTGGTAGTTSPTNSVTTKIVYTS